MTTTVAVAVSPGAIVPSAQSTGPDPEQPSGADAVTNVVPAGNVSTTCAAGTVAYPALVTMSVYWTSLPAVTGSGVSKIAVDSTSV